MYKSESRLSKIKYPLMILMLLVVSAVLMQLEIEQAMRRIEALEQMIQQSIQLRMR